MPQAICEIDQNGRLTVRIEGVEGPGCEDIARRFQALLEDPDVDEKTEEYFVQAMGTVRARGQ